MRLAVKFAVIVLLRRTTLSGGSLIIEFDTVASVCYGKSFRPLGWVDCISRGRRLPSNGSTSHDTQPLRASYFPIFDSLNEPQML
jgi:hypothetical protein